MSDPSHRSPIANDSAGPASSPGDSVSIGPQGSTPLAIVGIGCLFPKAQDKAAFWANIRDGVDAITDIPETHWRPGEYFHPDPKSPDMTYARRGGFIQPVDFAPLEFGISPANLEATDTSQLLGLWAARQALEDSGYGADREFDRDRVSVILGVTGALELVVPLGARLGHPLWRQALRDAGVDDATADAVVRKIADGYVPWQENSFPGLLGNVVAGRIANRLDLGGTNCVVDAACASSLSALHLASLELAARRADIVVTGGVDTFNDIFMYMCFSKTPALSPSGDARPFDKEGDGTILGEGIGILVLKRLDDARLAGDRVLAIIKGLGSSSDGKGNAIYAPSAEGQERCLRRAYEEAGISPAQIELVEAHGTGTKVGDATEAAALTKVFRESRTSGPWCALGSIKSQIGHTKAAAGAAALIKAAMALHSKTLPPTLKIRRPLDLLTKETPFSLNERMRPWLSTGAPRRAAVSAFGFGGSNFHCVLEEADSNKAFPDWSGTIEVIPFAGASMAQVQEQLKRLPKLPNWGAVRALAKRQRDAIDPNAPRQCVVVIDQRSWRPDQTLQVPSSTSLEPARSVFWKDRPIAPRLAFLFPGQGSPYVGMMRELVCLFPEGLAALEEAQSLYGEVEANERLVDILYPPNDWRQEDRAAWEARLRATSVAQIALAAVCSAALDVLARFGVRPDLVAGHSFGELVALHAAGVYSRDDLYRLAIQRGRLMAQVGAGSMLAVFARREIVEQLLHGRIGDVVVANHNSPEQVVLSGPIEAMERAKTLLDREGHRSTPLPVSGAFHHPSLDEVSRRFAEILNSVPFHPPTLPVFANSTAAQYPLGANEQREVLAGQLRRPVEFVRQIEAMRSAGATLFVEVGPNSVLKGLVEAIGVSGDQIIAFDAAGRRPTSRNIERELAETLARMVARGVVVDWSRWNEGLAIRSESSETSAFTVPLSGANYRQPRPASQATTRAPAREPNRAPEAKSQREESRSREHSLAPAESTRAPISGTMGIIGPSAPARAPIVGPTAINPARAQPSDSPSQDRRLVASPSSPGRSVSGVTHVSVPQDASVALRIAHESMLALQRLHEQTATVHMKFLEGQQQASSHLESLALLQHQLLAGSAAIPSPSVKSAAPTSSTLAPVSRPEGEIQTSAVHPPAAPMAPARHRPEPIESAATGIEPVVSATANGARVASPLAPPSAAADTVIAIVAEKTGYPASMLGMDLELDADLGIDSIKRVEILSAVQEALPGAPAVKSEELGNFRTLRDVVSFVSAAVGSVSPGHMAPLASGADGPTDGPTDKAPLPAAVGTNPDASLVEALLAVVADKTGYPVSMLGLDMELDGDLGIDSIKRVEILSAAQERLPHLPQVKSEQLGALRTLRDVLDVLGAGFDEPGAKDSGIKSAVGTSAAVATGEPIASTAERSSDSGARADAFSNGAGESNIALRRRRLVSELVAADAREPAPSTAEFLVTDDDSALSSEIVRALIARGQPARLIDLDPSALFSANEVIGGLVIVAPARGMKRDDLLTSLALAQRLEKPLRKGSQSGRAVFATIARIDGHFGLSSSRPVADALSGGLSGLSKTVAAEWPGVSIKAIDFDDRLPIDTLAPALADELFASGPTEIGFSEEGRSVLSLVDAPLPAEALRTLPIDKGDVVVVTGGARGVTAHVALALARAAQPTLVLLGRTPAPEPEPDWLRSIDGDAELKRAIASRLGPQGSPRDVKREFDAIRSARDVRANLRELERLGVKTIYRAVDVRHPEALEATLQEITSKHGRLVGVVHGAGVLADRLIADKTREQAADVLDTKLAGIEVLLDDRWASELRFLLLFSSSTARFGRRGQSDYAMANEALNKIACREARRRPRARVVAINWGPWAGGMVDASLAKVFEAEQVGLIDLEEGSRLCLQELRLPSDGAPSEVVVLASPADRGSDRPTAAGNEPSLGSATSQPTKAKIAPPTAPIVFSRAVDVESHSFLRSHVIGGHAVLPMAMMLEWLGQGALHNHPDLVFVGMDDFVVHRGVMIEEDQAEPIAVHAGRSSREGQDWRAQVEMSGHDRDGHRFRHASARVLLSDRWTRGERTIGERTLEPYPIALSDVYDEALFHGPELRGILEIEGVSAAGMVVRAEGARPPAEWMRRPLRSSWLADPLAIDVALQTAILWGKFASGELSLPMGIRRYRQYRQSFPNAGVRILLEGRLRSSHHLVATIELVDPAGELVARLEDVDLIADPSLAKRFRQNQLALPIST